MLGRVFNAVFTAAFIACLVAALLLAKATDGYLSDCRASGTRTVDECRQMLRAGIDSVPARR